MPKIRLNIRLSLALMAVLTAVGFLYFAQTDRVPHDRASRVTAEDFWAATTRPDPAHRPSDIVVYPPHLNVQLVTVIGHPAIGPSAAKYLYVKLEPGDQTVETRLAAMNMPFRTPWWDADWMKRGPWVSLGVAAFLLILPIFSGVLRILKQSRATAPATSGIAQLPATQVTEADLQKMHAMEENLERSLAMPSASAEPPAVAKPSPADTTAAPIALKGGPLEVIENAPKQQKDYRGEYYPVAKPKENKGFSLVELLVVIGILGILIGLLLPTLSGARHDANQVVCESNLRGIGQGLAIYENQNNGMIPSSYSYKGQKIVNGTQTYTSPAYTHWSYFLFGTGAVSNGMFQCPELEQGGLPPTNPPAGDLLPGQVGDTPGAIDEQAPRVAYTLNEALSPRNKFAIGFQGALRAYRFVQASSVANASGTILATEWGQNGARESAANSQFTVASHRPVNPFIGLDGTLDMYLLKLSVGYRRTTAADLDPDPASASGSVTRLDWVGRNHGHFRGYPDQRKTNFLYLDGHVECKTIYETLNPFEWGEKMYTLNPNGDLQQ